MSELVRHNGFVKPAAIHDMMVSERLRLRGVIAVTRIDI